MPFHQAYRAPALIQEFVFRLKELCEAEGAAVLLHSEPLDRNNLLLVFSGARIAPEIRSVESAWSFLSALRSAPGGVGYSARHGETDVRVSSAAADSRLLYLPQDNVCCAVTGGRAMHRLNWLNGDGVSEDVPDDLARLTTFLSLTVRLAWQVYTLSRSSWKYPQAFEGGWTDARSGDPLPPAAARKIRPPHGGSEGGQHPAAARRCDDLHADPAALRTALHAELVRQVRQAFRDNDRHPLPLGRWLHDDLVLTVFDACGQVARRAARVAGVPESTFRRQLDKARSEAESGLQVRSEDWPVVRSLLVQLVSAGMAGMTDIAGMEISDVNLLDGLRAELLGIVTREVGDRIPAGAALMGVTTPTYRRWLTRAAA